MKSFGFNRRFAHTSSDPMILEIDTTLSAGTTYSMGFWEGVTGMTVKPNFVIDWGDGTREVVTDSNGRAKTYASPGTYQIKIYGTCGGIGYGAASTTVDTNRKKLKRVIQWGNIKGLTALGGLCSQSSVTSLPSNFPSGVRDMFAFLYNCTTYNGSEITQWNTSNVTDMRRFFQGATAFNQNIGAWNVSNVTLMTLMFNGATAFNQNIGAWNVSNVTTMMGMFQNATAFNNAGSSSINNWNTSALTSTHNMFSSATSFNQPIGSWDVSKVTTMNSMLSGVGMTFNQNIGSWNLSSCTNLNYMFTNNTAFNQNISSWNVSNVTLMISTFQNATAFNQNISSWDVSKVTNMTTMFSGASAFNQNIGGWSLNNTVTMTNMLSNSGLSNENYSRTLIGWANYVSSTGTAKSRSLGATGRTYDDTVYSGTTYTTGLDARTYLTQSTASGGAGWTISGDSANYSIPAGSTGFLVDYASPKFAYSLRNLYSSYTGNVVRVRRSSDSTESNFTAAQVTDGTLTTWVGAGNDGFVTKWYDQSTNRNHLTQSTAASQPKIVSAGVLITDGDKPAVEFASDGNSWMQVTTRISDARSVFMTASSSYTGTDYMFILGDTVSGYTYHAGNTSLLDATYADAIVRNGTNKLNNVNSDFTASGPGGTRTALGRVLLSMIHTSSTGIINNVSKDRNNTGRSWKGKVQELVVYGTDQAANSNGIHSNVNSHYSIY